jgi:hypothetical protein
MVLRMLVRAFDRSIAPLVDRLRKDAEVLRAWRSFSLGRAGTCTGGMHRAKLGDLERYASLSGGTGTWTA